MDLSKLMSRAFEEGASDILISAGARPSFRIDGLVTPVDDAVLDAQTTREMVLGMLAPEQAARLERERELDFSLSSGGHRFRCNAYWQTGSVAAAFRLIPDHIPTPDRLGLPSSIRDLVTRPQGLLLITGASDQGKTTTQASLVDYLNRSLHKHIITIEDPIEFLHENHRSIVDQRELGSDTLSFHEALRHALRQSPDVIQVGEARDAETVRAALTAAETGHLVMTTLHTNDACQALDRIMDLFPAHQQLQVRTQLSACLVAVVAQRLVRSLKGKLVLALEVLVNNRAVSNMIHEGKIPMLYGAMETGRHLGMQTMNQSLAGLVEGGVIAPSEAKRYESLFESRHAPMVASGSHR